MSTDPAPIAQDLCQSIESQIDDVAQAVEQVASDLGSCEESSSDATLVSEVDVDSQEQEVAAEVLSDLSEDAVESQVECLHDDSEVVSDDNIDVSSDTPISNQRFFDVIATNTAVLQQVVAQFASLRQGDVPTSTFQNNGDASKCDADLLDEMRQLSDQVDDLYGQLDTAQQTAADLQQQLDEAWSKNERLVNELESAQSAPVQSSRPTAVAPQSTEVMTWEQRKELMLKQMEEDTFDADSFVESMQTETAVEVVGDVLDMTPTEYVSQLNEALQRALHEVEKRDEELVELREALEDGGSTPRSAIENGTAAIEDLVDVDALIRDERERLQNQQREWEERFRETEIAASLERAKLSRERRELGRKNAELEEQLIHFRRESEMDQKSGGKGSRRWLAMLGLSDE
ncbi:MAG: hypothetical protein WBD20_28235 [Pirellulaceae bacterium]